MYHKVTHTPPDPKLHPECAWDADVRLGEDLCLAERAYLHQRRRHMRPALASLLGVPLDEIDERDVPIIALAGSGGGLRAMCNTSGAMQALEEKGVLDCVSYVAGISGSCWALGALYSGVGGLDGRTGAPTLGLVNAHLQSRITVPYVDSTALELLTSPPTNLVRVHILVHDVHYAQYWWLCSHSTYCLA